MYFLSNIPILDATKNSLKNLISQRLSKEEHTIIFFANTNFVVKSQQIVNRLQNQNVFIANDGIGIDIANKIINGKCFRDNLNGTDFIPFYFDSDKIHKLYLIGSTISDLEKAASYFTNQLGQEIVGYCDGFQGIKNPNLINEINDTGANVVLVGMGNPLQELWILDNYQKLNAKLFLGVGALFVFLAGNKPRAPKWIRACRMEWFFRMLLEPKRLFRRYTIDILYFLYISLKNKHSTPIKEDNL